MAREPRLTHITALILQAVDSGFVYGFSIMEMTGLPSGTVYPAIRRMEEDQLIRSRWERQEIADREQRPPRKYYQLTSTGKTGLGDLAETLSIAAAAGPDRQNEVMMTTHLENAVRRMLVPRSKRSEWSREWRTELWYVRRECFSATSLNP